jgi:hypothetical protein
LSRRLVKTAAGAILEVERGEMFVMTNAVSLSAALLVIVLGAPVGSAKAEGDAATEHHGAVSGPPAGEKLGEVDFPISCDADSQKRFERAVAMLRAATRASG